MPTKAARPLSPHLQIWRWGPHMLVSILHRATGVGLATVGVLGFTWWLASLASGREAYATFMSWATWPPALVIPIGLTWAFFQHMANGIRHFVLDIGAGYELKTNKTGAIAAMIVAATLTILVWATILLRAV